MIVIGVDPGISGALAILGLSAPAVYDMPLTHAGNTGRKRIDAKELAAVIGHDVTGHGEQAVAFVEDVHATPQMGVSSAYSFGRSMGAIEGALASAGVEIRYVRPQVWKKALGLDSDKRKSLDKARRLYPQIAGSLARAKDDGRAEALLLAHYGCEELGL